MPVKIEDITPAPGDEAALTAILTPDSPLDFRQAMTSLKESGANDQTDKLDETLNWLERPYMIQGKPFLVRLTNLSTKPESPQLSLTVWADDTADDPPTTEIMQLAAELVGRRFYLDADMQAVREAIRVNEYGAQLADIYWPARPTALGGAWEALLKTVISNQIYPGLAVRLQQAVLEFYGTRVHFNGKEKRFFPTAEKLAELSPEDLLGMKFSRQKASYLPGIANAILENPVKFDFERLRKIPGSEAVAILDELPGVGPWTAHYVAMRGLPHDDVFIDEKGLRKTLATGYGKWADLTDDQFTSLTEVFAPYRSFACYYSYMKMYQG
jgi:DNA-3-methyladenine glycosylase II